MRYVACNYRPPMRFPKSLVISALEAMGRKHLTPAYQPVAPQMTCWPTVAKAVQTQGGSAVYGWSALSLGDSVSGLAAVAGLLTGLQNNPIASQMSEIKAMQLEAHCIWKTPQADLIELTEIEGAERAKFIPDPNVTPMPLLIVVFNSDGDRKTWMRMADVANRIRGIKTGTIDV